MPIDIDETDPTFIEDLRASKVAVLAAARWLSALGLPVVIRPTWERPDPSRMAEYSDDGDLEIIQRIEVKHRPKLDFTCRDDFPFSSVIVDVCHAWDDARPKPHAYIIFNAKMTHAIVVNGNTRAKWVRETKLDKQKNRKRNFYECPLEFVRFCCIPKDE